MLDRRFILQNKVYIAILVFLVSFWIFHLIKPGFAYQENGAFRPFGVGYLHKTVIPAWIIAILLAIFSYLLVMMYAIFR
jgi:hypothetical protein